MQLTLALFLLKAFLKRSMQLAQFKAVAVNGWLMLKSVTVPILMWSQSPSALPVWFSLLPISKAPLCLTKTVAGH